MSEFRMPTLGADMEAGTLVEWRVQPGAPVKRGDIVAVVDTEKAAIDVEIWIEGTVERILVQPGMKVPVGTVLAIIRTPAEKDADLSVVQAAPQPPAAGAAPVRTAAIPAATPAPAAAQGAAAAAGGEPRLRSTPLARRIAKELGVDLARVQGTGAGGAITQSDIERAVAPQPPKDKAAAMRRAIAAAMARSKREIPHYYLSLEISLDRALSWLEEANRQHSIEERMLYAVLLIKAVALAAREVPEMNGFWIGEAFQAGPGVHIGLAISLRQGGLVAPALHDADRKALPALMNDMRDLVARARAGSLRSSELSDPTLTVTNLGEQGVDSVFGIIFPPQVALVGFGRISPRRTVVASLSADHRASDGHRGGLFLAAVDRRLQSPEQL